MIASLPMYDRAETAPANDRLWALIRDELGEGPDALTRPKGELLEHWLSPDLLLSQTCGLPYRKHLHGRVQLVGTPDYALPGCPPGYYRSIIVVRADDKRRRFTKFRGAPFAVNGLNSQSGFAAFEHEANLMGFSWLDNHIVTGGHAASAVAVAEGMADIAALDEVTWALIQRYQPATAARLRVLDRTPKSPGLPLITALGRDPAPLRSAFGRAVNRLSPPDRAMLLLDGIADIPAEDYLAIPTPMAAT